MKSPPLLNQSQLRLVEEINALIQQPCFLTEQVHQQNRQIIHLMERLIEASEGTSLASEYAWLRGKGKDLLVMDYWGYRNIRKAVENEVWILLDSRYSCLTTTPRVLLLL